MSGDASSATWVERLKRHWRDFKAAPTGQRFQQMHERRQQRRRSPWLSAAFVVAGVLVMVGGAVMLFVPGPGLLALFAGAALVARESRQFCQVLDWMEQMLRPPAERLLRVWRKLSTAMKGLLVVLAVALLCGAGYAAYRFAFGG